MSRLAVILLPAMFMCCIFAFPMDIDDGTYYDVSEEGNVTDLIISLLDGTEIQENVINDVKGRLDIFLQLNN